MEVFLKANPGLSSRFDKILKFEDYSPEELTRIATKMIEDEGYSTTPKALELLGKQLEYIHKFRDKFFGNARDVRNIVLDVIKNQNLRLSALSAEGRSKRGQFSIIAEDILSLELEDEVKIFNKSSIGFKK